MSLSECVSYSKLQSYRLCPGLVTGEHPLIAPSSVFTGQSVTGLPRSPTVPTSPLCKQTTRIGSTAADDFFLVGSAFPIMLEHTSCHQKNCQAGFLWWQCVTSDNDWSGKKKKKNELQRELIRRDAYGLCRADHSWNVRAVYLCQTLETIENKTRINYEMSPFSPVQARTVFGEPLWRLFVVSFIVRPKRLWNGPPYCAGRPSFVESTILSVYCDFPPPEFLLSSYRIDVELIYLL